MTYSEIFCFLSLQRGSAHVEIGKPKRIAFTVEHTYFPLNLKLRLLCSHFGSLFLLKNFKKDYAGMKIIEAK